MKSALLVSLACMGCSQIGAAPAASDDPFLVELYDSLHRTPTQERFHRLAPMPVGVVYIQRPGEEETEIREHFRAMRQLGFTALKGIHPVPGQSREEIALMAIDEGLIPWWYGEAGWEPITAELLEKLGVPPRTPIAEIRDDPRMLAHQQGVMRRRVRKAAEWREAGRVPPKGSCSAFIKGLGDPGPELEDWVVPDFHDWTRRTYKTIEALNDAYNLHHMGLGTPFESWADFEERCHSISKREYRHIRDRFRFRADRRLEVTRELVAGLKAFDPHVPFRGGGEMGMFYPTAYWGVDMEGIADILADSGCFYPSIHLNWHFNEVNHEITRPVYMQASLATDIFKGGWSASWESTGGPQQWSGHKDGSYFTVDEGVITQLMLSHLAGGFKGFGFWCWSVRTAGGEAGEYGLLDRNNQVTARARRAGKIGQAARRYRDELWSAHKEPLVGVYFDWSNEALWAAMSVTGRDVFRFWPMQARIGVSRALMNANVPFEHVTATDLRRGLAPRYAVIYLPSVVSLDRDLLPRLEEYVRQGGRLVLDLPGAYFDERGALLPTGKGTILEKIFGATIDDFQGAGVNVSYRVEGLELEGFVFHTTPTRADVLATYGNGDPAVTQATSGKGTAVLLGWEAARMCFRPGRKRAESLLLKYTLGGLRSPYRCEGALVYRLASPSADHWFLVHDGEAREVTLETGSYRYGEVLDAISGEPVPRKADGAIPLWIEAHGGRWLRAVRQ